MLLFIAFLKLEIKLDTAVSIHLMLLFIKLNVNTNGTHKFVSIHLMLLFIREPW